MNFRQKITLSLLLTIVLGGAAFAQVVDIPDPALDATIRHALGWPPDLPIPQRELRRLESLDDRGRITDLTGLEHAVNLRNLNLSSNDIRDISPLAGLTKLEFLILRNNPIQDIAPLSNLARLTHLNLNLTPIADFTPLSRLTQLQELRISHCGFTDLTPIANLTQLTTLDLSNNRIDDITPLANLVRLTELDLSRNRIIDVSPLANLPSLKSLWLEDNRVMDISPIQGLILTHFSYELHGVCEIPRFSIQDRIDNRSMPSVFQPWQDGLDDWNDSMSMEERVAYHDMWWRIDHFSLRYSFPSHGYEIIGDMSQAMALREEMLSMNPNMLFLAYIRQAFLPRDRFPDDWNGWLRDESGNIISHSQTTLLGLIDIKTPEAQNDIAQRVIAHAKCGFYDGVQFDHWSVDRSLPFEQQFSLLRTIRENVPDDFLILFRTGGYKVPPIIPYINGAFMETSPNVRENGYTRQDIINIESALIWYETNALEPKINCLRGLGIGTEPPDSPNNRRWMRLFTTMSLTCSDGYVLYTLGDTPTGEKQYQAHIWHPFWDADLGQPTAPTANRYREIEGLYIREFTNGWAIYNRSGEPQLITLPGEVRGVASGLLNTEHTLPDLDGEIYLRVKPKNPADVNGDGVVNIFDLTLVAQSFGKDGLRGDVNGDGVINVFDLVFVANQF